MASNLRASMPTEGIAWAAGSLADAVAGLIVLLLSMFLVALLAVWWSHKANKSVSKASSQWRLSQQSSSSQRMKKHSKKGKKGRKVHPAAKKQSEMVSATADDEECAEQVVQAELPFLQEPIEEDHQVYTQDSISEEIKDANASDTEVCAEDALDLNTVCECACATQWGCQSCRVYSNMLLLVHRSKRMIAMQGPPGLTCAAERAVAATDSAMSALCAVSTPS